MPERIIRSRLVLNFPGFEGTAPLGQLERIRYCAERTGAIWGFKHELVSADVVKGGHHAIAQNVTHGPNWETRTRLVQFSWSDVIETYESDPFPQGMIHNFPKFLAFFFDGTVGRYRKAGKRYWAFTIFPLLLIALFALVSWFVVSWLVSAVLPVLDHPMIVLILTLAATLLLCRWPGKRAYLLLTINDWGFARDMVNRVNPAIENRFREFAETLTDEIGRSHDDEIIIAGHSFGSIWAVGALALALERDPDLLKNRNVVFLALGSSLLKIALAPKAGFMRNWAARIMAVPDLVWHEIQTKDDWIAFYKADPFATLGITDYAATLRIDRVKYKTAMEKKRYWQSMASPYRAHRQYILYQDKRVFFDYILRLFGPLSAYEMATRPEITEAIGPDGALANAN